MKQPEPPFEAQPTSGSALGRRAWLRRLGAGACAASCAAAALRTGAAFGAPPQDENKGEGEGEAPEEVPATPPRLLIVGDSMIAGGFGLYLAQDLERDHGVEVVRKGKSSTGLARPDFYDWIKQGKKLVKAHRPDAVACMFGGNDGQGLYMGHKADPKWTRYNDEGWTVEYRRRVNAFADAMTPDGQCLLWIGMPIMRPPKLSGRVEHMNTIFRAEMAIRPHAQFIDIWRTMADDEGAFTDKLEVGGKRVTVRAKDGVHMSRSGAHYLADVVQLEIAPHMHAMAAAQAAARSEAEPETATGPEAGTEPKPADQAP